MGSPDLLHLCIFFALFVMTFGGCQFPIEWSGRWFQSGIVHLITVNSTYIETKGECLEKDGDKFIVIDRSDRDVGHRCIVIHQKHPNVLQYKESPISSEYTSLDSLCHEITGDAVLLSMFRAEDATPIPCPFKSPPYSFSYNRGSGDCNVPPSRADSCTDESRLLLKFLACPDVSGTESTVEELVCLAKWKDGNTRYLVGKIQNAMVTSDEDRYRCFVYDRKPGDNKVVYNVAQSGDATCNALSLTEGGKLMLLTRIETQHERCKFPSWVTNHHHWHSLDYRHSYHFSHKNATLKISREHGVTDMRLVCHNIENNSSSVTLVAHATEGCTSGYICLVFHRRDVNVIQLQQSNKSSSDPAEACKPSYFDYNQLSDPVTLVTASELPSIKCSLPGRYGIKQFTIPNDLKRRSVVETSTSQSERCTDQLAFSSLTVGCNGILDTIEFQSSCPEEQNRAYYCHGSWADNMTTYLISSPVSRKSTDAKRYCFVFKKSSPTSSDLTVLPESCSVASHRRSWVFNLTSLGQCIETSASSDSSLVILPSSISLVFSMLVVVFITVLR